MGELPAKEKEAGDEEEDMSNREGVGGEDTVGGEEVAPDVVDQEVEEVQVEREEQDVEEVEKGTEEDLEQEDEVVEEVVEVERDEEVEEVEKENEKEKEVEEEKEVVEEEVEDVAEEDEVEKDVEEEDEVVEDVDEEEEVEDVEEKEDNQEETEDKEEDLSFLPLSLQNRIAAWRKSCGNGEDEDAAGDGDGGGCGDEDAACGGGGGGDIEGKGDGEDAAGGGAAADGKVGGDGEGEGAGRGQGEGEGKGEGKGKGESDGEDADVGEDEDAAGDGSGGGGGDGYKQIRLNIYRVKASHSTDDFTGKCRCESSGAQCNPNSKCDNVGMRVECTAEDCEPDCQNQRMQRHAYAKYGIREYGDKGKGLAAVTPLAADDLVIEYVGEVISEKMLNRRREKQLKSRHSGCYTMKLGKDRYIDATRFGNDARFMNHSCNPNCEMRKWWAGGSERIGLFSIECVEPGDELTMDYFAGEGSGNVVWLQGSTWQACLCKSPSCSESSTRRGRTGSCGPLARETASRCVLAG